MFVTTLSKMPARVALPFPDRTDAFVYKQILSAPNFRDFSTIFSELRQSEIVLKMASSDGGEPWKEVGRGGRPRKGQETPNLRSKGRKRSRDLSRSGLTPEEKKDTKGGKNPPGMTLGLLLPTGVAGGAGGAVEVVVEIGRAHV